MLFDIETINSKIINSVIVSNVNVKHHISSINNNIPFERIPENTLDIGTNDILIQNPFQSLKRHFDV